VDMARFQTFFCVSRISNADTNAAGQRRWSRTSFSMYKMGCISDTDGKNRRKTRQSRLQLNMESIRRPGDVEP